MGVGPLVKTLETDQWEWLQKIQVPTVPHQRVGPRELPASSRLEVWLACSCTGNYSYCEVVHGRVTLGRLVFCGTLPLWGKYFAA